MFKRHTSTSSRLTQIAQKRSGQPGQVAVVVLLIMAALLIIVLNYASRTTDQVFLSGQQQDSTRVFNAAESGVEEALSQFQGDQAPLPGDLTGTISDIELEYKLDPQSNELRLANLSEGMTATVYLTGENSLTIDWSGASTCNSRASLILALYYEQGGDTKTIYTPVRPSCYSNGQESNGFVNATTTRESGTPTYYQSHEWDIEALGVPSGSSVLARITAVYASTSLRVTGVSSVQAHDVTVRASDTDDAIGATGTFSSEERAIQVTRTIPAPPMVLDYAVYSGGSLTKTN